ncbi:hypothetical protein [Streptomyces sp. YIM 98790]|nr:hypothetical protein [Streptomyces sp. YIM 98790]
MTDPERMPQSCTLTTTRPDRDDVIGPPLCLAGMAVIMFVPRSR